MMSQNLRRRMIAALTAATLTAGTAALAIPYDPAYNIGAVTVELGKDVEQTLKIPLASFASADAVAEDINLKAIEGPAGVTATVVERKIVTASDGTKQLELKVKIAAEAFKGTGAGAYELMMTLDNTEDQNSRNFFVTLSIQ